MCNLTPRLQLNRGEKYGRSVIEAHTREDMLGRLNLISLEMKYAMPTLNWMIYVI